MDDARDSEYLDGPPRSRKAFRWMPSPVLWHNLPRPESSAPALGRNLYARKLRESTAASDPPREDAIRSEILRWQSPLTYLVIARSRGWLLTWHAPWCRRCDCAGAGWTFSRGRGYWSGLGFELSFPQP